MMKKVLKTGASVITAICMVMGLAVAAKSVPVSAADTYKNWTYATVGIGDGETGYINSADNIAAYSEQPFSIDGSKFSGYVKFSASHDANVNNYTAPRLTIGAVNGDVWNQYPIIFGLKTFNEGGVEYTCLSCAGPNGVGWIFRDKQVMPNEEIFLQVTFDYIGSDLQMHVWIDGTPVSSVQEYGTWAMVGGEDIRISNYVDAANPVKSNIMLHYGTSNAEKVTVRSAYGLTVSGIENNKTYCKEMTATIATTAPDGALEKDLASVTLGGIAVTLNNGSFTIPAGTGATTVVVTDKAGTSQTINVTVNNGHTWGTEYYSNNDATCQADGTKSTKCIACETLNTEKVADTGTKLEHKFETYKSDGDATCVADGHETAACEYGCGTTDRRVATGSKTGEHTYGTDDKCTVCKASKPVENQPGGTTGGATTGAATGNTQAGGVQTGDTTLVWVFLAAMVFSAAVIALGKKNKVGR